MPHNRKRKNSPKPIGIMAGVEMSIASTKYSLRAQCDTGFHLAAWEKSALMEFTVLCPSPLAASK